MKSYTDLSQSKKLAEILPLESADMEYILEQWIDEKTHRHKEGYYEIPVVKVDDDCPLQPITLPCWSLAALLSVLPKSLIYTPNQALDGYCCKNIMHDLETYGDNPVDACVKMIIKLHEQKLL